MITPGRRLLAVAALCAALACSACSGESGAADESGGSGGSAGSGGGQADDGSGGNASGGAGTGGSSPGSCPETDLEFVFDGDHEQSDIDIAAAAPALSFRTAAPQPEQPNFGVAIVGIDSTLGSPATISLADGPRIDWSLGSNGSGIPSAIVSTMPSGGNQIAGEFAGTLVLTNVGTEVGDARCGTIELLLSYLDEDGTPHEFTAEGSFQTTLSPPEMP